MANKRPRSVLLSFFPNGTITPEEASNALRESDGNIEDAKKLLQQSKSNNKSLDSKSNTNNSKPAAAKEENGAGKKPAAYPRDNNNHDTKDNIRIIRPTKEGVCAICFCEYTTDDGLELQNCNHAFCEECIATYIQSKAKDGEVTQSQMKCPSVDPKACGCPIAQSDVLACLASAADRDRYLRLTIDRCVDNDDNMGCCPTAGCSFLFEWDEDNRKLDCPLCEKSYCLVCKVGPWHSGVRCEQYQAEHKDDGAGDDSDKDFRKFASKQKLKQCPKCKFWVEKSYGCDAMHCRCNLVFCYKCGGCLKGTAQKGGYKVCSCQSSQGILQAHEGSGLNVNHMPQRAGGMMPPPFAAVPPGFPGGGFPNQHRAAPAFAGAGNRLGGPDRNKRARRNKMLEELLDK